MVLRGLVLFWHLPSSCAGKSCLVSQRKAASVEQTQQQQPREQPQRQQQQQKQLNAAAAVDIVAETNASCKQQRQ